MGYQNWKTVGPGLRMCDINFSTNESAVQLLS